MANRRNSAGSGLGDKVYPPATTPEARESQLVAMAYDLAEKRMRDGTASAQEVVHFLRMGSQKDQLERDIMREQKKLVTAKTGSYETGKHLEELYDKMMNALKSYNGADDYEEPQEIF